MDLTHVILDGVTGGDIFTVLQRSVFNLDHWLVLAQQVDPDPLAGSRSFFMDLVASGKLWYLLTGLVLGYFIRQFTTFG